MSLVTGIGGHKPLYGILEDVAISLHCHVQRQVHRGAAKGHLPELSVQSLEEHTNLSKGLDDFKKS